MLCALLCAIGSLAAQGAWGGDLLVVVGSGSTLHSLDKNEVRNIFLGRISSLPDGSAAVPVDQPESSPLREEFYTKVTNNSAAEAKARWAQLAFTGRGEPPRVGNSSRDVKRIISSTPGAVGYIEESELDSSVKVVLKVE